MYLVSGCRNVPAQEHVQQPTQQPSNTSNTPTGSGNVLVQPQYQAPKTSGSSNKTSWELTVGKRKAS